eukprot:2215010-Karenia_brevis.AAC.1
MLPAALANDPYNAKLSSKDGDKATPSNITASNVDRHDGNLDSKEGDIMSPSKDEKSLKDSNSPIDEEVDGECLQGDSSAGEAVLKGGSDESLTDHWCFDYYASLVIKRAFSLWLAKTTFFKTCELSNNLAGGSPSAST